MRKLNKADTLKRKTERRAKRAVQYFYIDLTVQPAQPATIQPTQPVIRS